MTFGQLAGILPANATMRDIYGMSGQYPDEIRFALAERQRRKILYVILVLASPGAAVALIASSRLSDRGFGAVVGGACAIVLFVIVYAAFTRNVTVLDERGLRTRWHLLPVRRCNWEDVRLVRVITTGNSPSRYVKVEPRAAKPFHLGAPLDTAGMRDPQFGDRADEILRYWSAATRPKPPPPRLGPEDRALRYRHHGLL
jgi:hypothetical protein